MKYSGKEIMVCIGSRKTENTCLCPTISLLALAARTPTVHYSLRRFQNEDFTIASPLGGGKLEAFEAITKRFIADGAPDEVNLR